jgi:hypothetical protein
MNKPKNDKGIWVVVKDQDQVVRRVVFQSVHGSEKSALSAQRRNGGRIVRVAQFKWVATPGGK